MPLQPTPDSIVRFITVEIKQKVQAMLHNYKPMTFARLVALGMKRSLLEAHLFRLP